MRYVSKTLQHFVLFNVKTEKALLETLMNTFPGNVLNCLKTEVNFNDFHLL